MIAPPDGRVLAQRDRPGLPLPPRHLAWLALTAACCCSCYGPPKLPPGDPLVVMVRANPATGRELSCADLPWNVDRTALEQLAGSLREELRERRGLAVTTRTDRADVIVEILGRYDPSGIVNHQLCAKVYAARDPRVPLRSQYETQFGALQRYRWAPGAPVGRYAAGVEAIVRDNFVRIVSVRNRAAGDTGPLHPTTNAPLQGEYELATALSPSCAASPLVASSSTYRARLYQHGDELCLLLPDAPFDKMSGRIAGDGLSLSIGHSDDILFIMGWSNSEAGALRWQGRITGHVREERIEAAVSGTVSSVREQRLYTCEASDHRWTLTRRR